MNVLRLIIVDRRIVEAIIFLNRNIIHKILLFKNCFREISIKRMLTIIIPIQKRRIAAVCKAVGVDLIQKETLFPHSPPAAKADQNDHKKRDRPFFLFCFLHSFCFSSLFCPFCSQIWLCFSSISYLEHKSKLFGLQIPLLLAACTLLDIPSRWNP